MDMTKKILLIGVLSMLLIGCGLKSGIIERLAITGIAQELGIEFAKHNSKLAGEAVIFLDTMEALEGSQVRYVNMLEVGINYAYAQIDSERAARMKPFVDEMMAELGADPDALDLGKIELPDGFDYPALKAAVRGFRSGVLME